ncbi:MAG: CHAD domain-containing protein [Vicinamibacterales bacterium]
MTPSHPLCRPFERQIRLFGKQLPRAVNGEIEPLHQCRIATRRLREILPLCASEAPRGVAARARRRLRRVGRALGGVREIDVALGLVDEFTQRGVVDADAAERLHQHLRDERDERRERLLDRLSAVNTRRLERDLAEVARVLGMRDQTDVWARTLAARLRRRAQRVREAVSAAGALYTSDRVHRVRITAKQLRYALEFAGDSREGRTKGAVRVVKGLQEILGRLHDLEVLAGTIQDFIVPSVDHASWNSDLKRFRLELDRECRELHSRYVARREDLLEICDMTSRLAVRIWTDRGGEIPSQPVVKARARVLKMGLAGSWPADRKAARH